MRTVRWVGLLVAAAGLASPARAEPGKYTAAVVLPEIELRSGPSWQYKPTGKVRKGEQVIVHHEDGGWAAVVPLPGAVSFVNHRFLGEFDPNGSGKQNALVMADNVEVRVGVDKGGPLPVTQVKLPRGTWVEIAGPKTRDENTTWYPITPPEGEYRWLPKEALGAPAPLTPPPVFVKSGQGDKTPGTLTSVGPKPAAAVGNAQWDKAEQAEKAGDYALAEKLYTLLYQDLQRRNSDPELLLVCYNRIIKCQDRLRLDGGPRPAPAAPSSSDPAKSPAALQAPTGSNTGASGLAWPNDPKATGGQRWTGPGSLRRAGFTIDGKQAYALENSRGQLTYYVTAGPNVSLDQYVNRQVDLLGNVQVRGEIRGAQYMVVTQVK
jgi:hypothetical protein